MKFTIALFLGIVSATNTEELRDAVNALKIRISKAGQREIEDEANDIEPTIEKIRYSKPARNLKNSLERFSHTKAVANLKKLDKKFWASPQGKRLAHEWMDVGHVLDQHLYHNKNGIHFPNEHMNELSDELNDVAHKYEDLEGSKWDKAYEAGFKAAGNTKQWKSVERRAKTFKHSKEGAMLKKEIVELKNKIKQHVKVSDLPDHWKDQADLLKITVSKKGQAKIEKEANDIEKLGNSDEWQFSKPVRNMENSLERWERSDEVEALKALDKKFLASPEGKELMLEWQDFGEAMKDHIYENDTGIHIDEEGMHVLEDEMDDIEHEYKMLEGSKWHKAYDAAWTKATTSPEAKSVGRRFETFSTSAEWKAMEKELTDLDLALKKHVKISDLPKNEVEMLKLSVSPAGQKQIETEAEDVRQLVEDEKWHYSKPVRNMENSLERWGRSDEVKAIEALDKKFLASPEGKELMLEWQDFGEAMKDHIKETKNGIHIDQEGMHVLGDEMDDIEHEYKMLHGSKWEKAYEGAWEKATTSPEAQSVKRRFDHFKESAEAKALHKEVKELKQAIKKNVKITDLPEDNMYLF